jgi:hypothetical protein
MKRIGIAIHLLLIALLAGAAFAQAPVNGSYSSTDIGGLVYVGRYSEGWDSGGGAIFAGTTLNCQSWDGASLGTQWKYWCSTASSDAILMSDTVKGNGNGTRTYMKTFVGGYMWLDGAGPWGGGDVEYTGVIDTYIEYETITYEAFVPIAAVTNVEVTAHFDSYPQPCMTFYIGNGTRVATTEIGETIPADYPGLLDPSCDATRTEGAVWDFYSITLTVSDCEIATKESSWGAIKSMYRD